MKKEYVEMHDAHLLSRQRVLLRAFAINTALVILVWLLTFIPGFIFLGVIMTGISAPMFLLSAIGTLAVWGLAGVALFLVPGLAIWWERKMIK